MLTITALLIGAPCKIGPSGFKSGLRGLREENFTHHWSLEWTFLRQNDRQPTGYQELVAHSAVVCPNHLYKGHFRFNRAVLENSE